MKKPVFITAAILLFIVIFLLVGLVLGNARFTQELEIGRPPKVVYYAMMNPMKMDAWIQGFQKAEALDGFLNGPGSRYLMTLIIGGHEIKVLEEVTSFVWKEELGLKLNFKHFTANLDIRLEETEKGTRVYIKNIISGNNLFWKIMVPYLKPGFKRHMNKNWYNLKDMLE